MMVDYHSISKRQAFILFTLTIILTGCSSIPQPDESATVTQTYYNPLLAGHPAEYDLSTLDPKDLMSVEEFPESNRPPYSSVPDRTLSGFSVCLCRVVLSSLPEVSIKIGRELYPRRA